MNIDMQIDTLSRVLVTVLGVSVVVVSAALIYIVRLCLELRQEILRRREARERSDEPNRV